MFRCTYFQAIILPPEFSETFPSPCSKVWLCLAWPLPALLFWLAEHLARRRRMTTATGDGESSAVYGDATAEADALMSPMASPMGTPREFRRTQPSRFKVMFLSGILLANWLSFFLTYGKWYGDKTA